MGNLFYDHLKDLISVLQHGFLPNRSCVTQLLLALHTVGQSLDNNIQSNMIYLDFAKAFDTVDHSALLAKLRLYDVKGQLFCWFKAYLTERTQRVVLENTASHWSPVTSVVPQGSILGPLLFTLFINDLPDEAAYGLKVALYADDTKLYRNVSSAEHCNLIQDTLSNMHVWSQRNNIRFNTSKCKVLTVTRKKTPIAFDYTLDGTALTRVSEEKDLGVIITSTLSWDSHIHTITAKANKLLGLLKRTCPLLTSVSVRRSLCLWSSHSCVTPPKSGRPLTLL